MKLSELARYQAARELTTIERTDAAITLNAPFAAPLFTFRVGGEQNQKRSAPVLSTMDEQRPLQEVRHRRDLRDDTWLAEPTGMIICLNLPRGRSSLTFQESV